MLNQLYKIEATENAHQRAIITEVYTYNAIKIFWLDCKLNFISKIIFSGNKRKDRKFE